MPTRHQRAAYDRAYVGLDDSFLQGPSLQGPQATPRNHLADAVRNYGLYGLSDRLNDPTSGAGIVADGVGGLLNMLAIEPYRSANRLLSTDAMPGDLQRAEDAFNVAGAAMVGGMAAPRPRATAPSNVFTAIGYHGAPTNNLLAKGAVSRELDDFTGHGGPWLSSSRDVANTYTVNDFGDLRNGANVMPARVEFKNPMYWDAQGREGGEAMVKDEMVRGRKVGIAYDTNDISEQAARLGHDGLVVRNVRDEMEGGGALSDVYHPIQRGTVFNPVTGELLYANGNPGGAIGNLLSQYGYEQPWTARLRPGDI